jgi:hypothetical protein
MVSLLNPVVAENRLLAGMERSALRALRRPSPSDDRFPKRAVEDRIRRVFRLSAADRLPLVRQKTLRDYHAHLARFLSFPFRASHCEELEPLVLDGSVIATALCDPAQTPLDSTTGILCEVVFRNILRLPLALLKVDPRNPNCQMIDDYWHWFWNCR